jgi:DMSO reductase family type II enzyme chaperone
VGGRGRLADLAQVRQGVYRLLGSLLLYPESAHVEATVALARELRDESAPLRDFPFYPRLRSVLDSLARMTRGGAAKLEAEYVELFVLSVSRAPCLLHESAYVDRTGRKHGLVAVAVERAYAASGVALSPSAAGELPDHAGFELEFLSHLCAQEAQAWEARAPSEAVGRLRSQAQFLDRHLLRWFPILVRRVNDSVDSAGIYGLIVEAAHAFVVHDRDLIGVLAQADALPILVTAEP